MVFPHAFLFIMEEDLFYRPHDSSHQIPLARPGSYAHGPAVEESRNMCIRCLHSLQWELGFAILEEMEGGVCVCGGRQGKAVG